ncbi:vacuolar protein sorting-associated protein 9A-like isoform X2 [Magnolia sinica]|uniref:vacuolar protein sorting-associated protein 9A-like isoform X2 n=1 Tax=Magnolia sinica TaxID=86752 RepID=UPI0026596B6B|nr:vacuolar protein sorting-associated protein 9A-like isoform X2 [Magnolia sinica]
MNISSLSTPSFYDFLDRMRHPASLDLVRSIKSFIVSFSFNAANPENDSKRLQEFLLSMEATIKDHPLWAGATEEEIDNAIEIAVKELQKINSSRAPREKLLCILNCCRVINNLLLNVSMSTDHIPAGADDFLPVLIYVTIKANPPQLHSNLKFIQLFRRQSKLISEAAYYLTNLISAESFIMALDANSLSIGENEFHESMQAARLAEAARIGSSTTSTSSTGHVPTMRRCNEDIDTRGRKYPYMEAEAEDLTLEDVPKLLSAYKDVVTKYSMLRKAVRGLSLNEETLPSILREDLANCVLQQLEMTELEGSNSAQHGTGR